MPHLPSEWLPHFAAGVSHRVGSCARDGTPGICRALAAQVLSDGRVQALVAADAGPAVLGAVADTAQVALVLAHPQSHRTLHLKGRDAVVADASPEHAALLESRCAAFAAQLAPLGFPREMLERHWYAVGTGGWKTITFAVSGAWDQTPGPGAGQPLELR